MPNLYIISGCNGAGKTTASYTILPEILNCREFVNADNIAAGLSPFNPESVALEAGRTMLLRIGELMADHADFAIETTLATRSYVSLIKRAHLNGYRVSLLYFWLSSPDVAVERVAKRVANGGHHIPSDTIERRYYRGIYNLYNLYMSVCDEWTVVDNTDVSPEIIAQADSVGKTIFNNELWNKIKKDSHGKA
ncbi:zeta toxin family protein [Pedobacter sp. MR2016-24]|uniref:zeta toxin family protein n=1 Tax=Pedobacter sp. MR2016-24 TaxID=2994466 RepID=UPI002247C550|nr:zeta toxin family protein [Pedobacter sp. MR2016-24]MCX2486793.1 zeta toxin family protein [Pedobacter sp. MR2016-24]